MNWFRGGTAPVTPFVVTHMNSPFHPMADDWASRSLVHPPGFSAVWKRKYGPLPRILKFFPGFWKFREIVISIAFFYQCNEFVAMLKNIGEYRLLFLGKFFDCFK